jgi:hypothetical protein
MRRTAAGFVAVMLLACGHEADVRRDSRSLSKAAAKGAQDLAAHVVPSARARVDTRAVAKGGRNGPWSRALSKPEAVELRAVVMVTPDDPVEARETDHGWAFTSDPTDRYGQGSPRQALSALVRASRAERWDVLVRLAPRRYRIGLSEKDLKAAWTEGEHASSLGEARDRVDLHLAGQIVSDAHEATLELGEGHVARLEREDGRWVVVDF